MIKMMIRIQKSRPPFFITLHCYSTGTEYDQTLLASPGLNLVRNTVRICEFFGPHETFILTTGDHQS